MRWGNSYLFLLFLLLPVLGAFFVWVNWRQNRLLKKFCEAKFLAKLIPDYSFVRPLVKQSLWLIAFIFLVVTLAEPKWGYHFEEVVRKGSDLIIAVDVSNSMLAEDIKPNRLERVKRKIYDLLQMAKGDRIGLVAFAGKAILLCPLTLDYQAVDQFLESLNTDLIPIQGTDFTGALQIALKSFKDSKNSKAILLFTDGEDHGPELQSVLKELKEKNIPLYILGVGTPEGAPIPLPKGQGGFKRDEAGNVVISKLNEKELANLAVASGGEYVRSVTSDADLTELYAKGLKGALTGSEIKSGKKRVYETRFQWPLGIALLLWLIEFFVGEKKRNSEGRLFLRKHNKAMLKSFFVFSVFVLNSLLFALPAQAGIWSWLEKYQGGTSYAKKDYAEAQNYFSKSLVDNPKDLSSAYNLGNSYYRGGDYLKAAESYAKAGESTNPILKERSLYNLGNSFYKAGEWEKSISAYEQALKIDAQDKEAQLNLEFVKKKLEEKKKQQSSAPQNSQGENKKQNSGDQNSDQSGQSSSSGEQKQNSDPNQNSKSQNSEQNSQQDSQKQPQDSQNEQKQNEQKQNEQKQEAQNSNQNSQDQKQDSGQKNNSNQNNNGSGDDQKQDPSKNPSNPQQGQNDNSQKPEGKLEGRNQPSQAGQEQKPGTPGQTAMKPEEAKALLDSVQEDAAAILKGQVTQKLGKTKRVEKDW